MSLVRRAHGDVEIITLPTRLDTPVAAAVRAELLAVVAGGRTRVLLDASEVKFIDSSGLSVLVSTLKAARAASGNLGLLKVSKPMRTLLELTRLHRAIQLFDDEAAAAAALA